MSLAVFEQLGTPVQGGVVCVADHASNRVPPGIELGIAESLLDEHIALDIGVDAIARRMARLLAIPAHLATVSRLVIDLHREEDHPALVPVESDGHPIPGNRGADVGKRIELFYRPYHEALAGWLEAARPRLIVSLHSFTPRLRSRKEDRPWQVALLYNRDDRAARLAIDLFAEMGLCVGDNQPYSGRDLNATMNRHAEAHDRPYLAVEIRQDLIENEEGQALWADRLAQVAKRVALALDERQWRFNP